MIPGDPYFSVWSRATRLTDDRTRRWTDQPMSLNSLIRVDGLAYRLMGVDPKGVPALPQQGMAIVRPTRLVYQFDDERVTVTFTFMTPAFNDYLDTFARPVTYLTWTVRSADGRPHAVALYDSVSSQLAVNRPAESMVWKRETFGPLAAMGVGKAAART